MTNYPGDERDPSYSPDGRQVAFSWNGENDGPFHIYITLVGEQHKLQLTSGEYNDSYPAWSPDGKQIAFLRRQTDTEGDIMLTSSLGGSERTLHHIRIGGHLDTLGKNPGVDARRPMALLHQRTQSSEPSQLVPFIPRFRRGAPAVQPSNRNW